MKANYKRIEDIKVDIQSADIEEIWKFDNHGRYSFYKCEACTGPILGHLEVKCRALNGAGYDPVTEKSDDDDSLFTIQSTNYRLSQRIVVNIPFHVMG